MLPSDSSWPSAFAVGMPRKVAKNSRACQDLPAVPQRLLHALRRLLRARRLHPSQHATRRYLYRLYIGIAKAVILSTGTPIPAQWKCRRRCRYRAAYSLVCPGVHDAVCRPGVVQSAHCCRAEGPASAARARIFLFPLRSMPTAKAEGPRRTPRRLHRHRLSQGL